MYLLCIERIEENYWPQGLIQGGHLEHTIKNIVLVLLFFSIRQERL